MKRCTIQLLDALLMPFFDIHAESLGLKREPGIHINNKTWTLKQKCRNN